MAKIISENSGKAAEIADGDPIKYICEDELGVMFGCKQGMCGTCRIHIVEGMENLFEKNDRENDMSLDEDERLTCQCKIKTGTIKIRLDY